MRSETPSRKTRGYIPSRAAASLPSLPSLTPASLVGSSSSMFDTSIAKGEINGTQHTWNGRHVDVLPVFLGLGVAINRLMLGAIRDMGGYVFYHVCVSQTSRL